MGLGVVVGLSCPHNWCCYGCRLSHRRIPPSPIPATAAIVAVIIVNIAAVAAAITTTGVQRREASNRGSGRVVVISDPTSITPIV